MRKNKDEFDDDFDEIIEHKKSNPIRTLFFIIILLIALIIVYGIYIGPSGLSLKTYDIKTSNIPDSFNNFKIVHFSDFHYGNTSNEKELKNLVNKINNTKPDIVVFTGDLIDQTKIPTEEDIKTITELLKQIDSNYGKYYVTGDHDIKFDGFDKIMENSDFTSLNDNYDVIYNKNNESIFISGINYKSTGDYLKKLNFNELPQYRIVVMHTPDTIDKVSDLNFDLALAGHSLNGIINIPLYGGLYKVEGAKNYSLPYYKVDNTEFYISSGIGTSEIKFRLFNRPSFSLYKLKK